MTIAAAAPTLWGRRLLFVTGKGGVGKSAVAAALARCAAADGRRVLVCEMTAHGAIGPLLGAGRPLEHAPREIEPGLWACNLDCERTVADAVAELVPTPRLARALLGNRVARLFLRTAPAVVETAVHLRLQAYVRQDFDQVIVDLPATGHAVTFLDASRSMAAALRVGRVAREAAEAAALLRDPARTGLVLVTLPEEMPVNEAVELYGRAREHLGIVPTVVLVNRVHGPPVAEGDLPHLEAMLATAPSDPEHPAGGVLASARMGLRAHALDLRQLGRLRAALPEAPLLFLPVLRDAADEPALVARLAELIAGLAARAPARAAAG